MGLELHEIKVVRHKAAIRRGEPSLPIKCLRRDGLIASSKSFFDFGCGHGEDIRHVADLGIESAGWDPAYKPADSKKHADIVNLGYVLNVIEDLNERRNTLSEAWRLSERLLVVSARIRFAGDDLPNGQGYSDGIVTRRGTFQKFFTQSELREYIEAVLGQEADPAALGVFYVFRDEELRQHYHASRYQRRRSGPKKLQSELRFEQHRELLQPLMEWILDRGRKPKIDEFDQASQIDEAFGSINRAFALIKRVTGNELWEEARRSRTNDLLVYLALSHFRHRPKISKLPISLQRDIRAFFGSYKNACQQADHLLFQVGDADVIDAACQKSPIGYLQANSLWLHRTALNELEPILRAYEGCARAYVGDMDDAQIIKLHRHSGKVSYFACQNFENEPHPKLDWCVKLSLRSRELHWYDYSEYADPKVLHAKEAFISADDPLRPKFQRLTQQEIRWRLLQESTEFRKRSAWEQILEEKRSRLKGHRLVRR